MGFRSILRTCTPHKYPVKGVGEAKGIAAAFVSELTLGAERARHILDVGVVRVVRADADVYGNHTGGGDTGATSFVFRGRRSKSEYAIFGQVTVFLSKDRGAGAPHRMANQIADRNHPGVQLCNTITNTLCLCVEGVGREGRRRSCASKLRV